MKGNNPTPPKKRSERRAAGQMLASAVMILCLAFAGVTTYINVLSRPEALTVQPGAVWQLDNQKLTETEEEASAPAGAPSQEAEAEAPAQEAEAQPQAQPQAQPDAPAQGDKTLSAAPEESPAEQTPATRPETPAEEPAAPAAPEGLEEENGLGLDGGSFSLLNAENSPWAQETEALSAEDPLAAWYEGVDFEQQVEETGQILLTPEQVDVLLASDRCLGITKENFMDWLMGSEMNFLQWLFNLIFGGVSTPQYSGWKTIDGKTYYYDENTHLAVTGIQTIDSKIYYFDGSGVLQENVTFGIDVSKYQPNVDWKKVKQAGAEFVIIRIGYRGYGSGTLVLDPLFETHYAGAKAAGLRIGVYIFSQAINEDEAREEAFACAYVLNGRKLDYPIYFDSEYAVPGAHTGRADNLTKAERTACAVAFCEEVKIQGYEPGVYASTNWFSTQLDFRALNSYSIWNAHYGVSSSRVDCDLWQGSCDGRISGINGDVDINISYIG